MTELNLLPDIKLEYLRAERARRLVFTVAVLVTAASIIILVLLLVVDLAQKKHLSDLTSSINSESSQLEAKPDISKILTVQNQLQSLTPLHAAKPAASALFNTYLDEITPANVSITDLTIDFNQHTISITGGADSLATIDQYVDTLKFTTYKTDSSSTGSKAFSSVVLASFSNATTAAVGATQASYNITASYDPAIFDSTQNVTLKVPNQVTTRSDLAQPGDLFKADATKTGSGE